jgi:glutamate--cysteine ligase
MPYQIKQPELKEGVLFMSVDFQTPGYEGMQLSTQIIIAEALKRGVEVKVVDRLKNFISLQKNDHIEYVRMASLTSKDSIVSFFITANKEMTKQLLSEAGLRVPDGKSYTSAQEAKKDFNEFNKQKIVVKPKSLGFGRGITIVSKNSAMETYEHAVDVAFAIDSAILIEEFIEGIECRFLVIDGCCVSVLHRVPANVTGDGQSTISDLVRMKNNDPRRGKGHTSPLEKIRLREPELLVLSKQNLTPDFIISKGTRVFLRENSNLSTGGDSLDYYDLVHPDYKQLSIQAAKAVQATVCGVDIILKDHTQAMTPQTYAILEVNHNPGLGEHNFPYEGQNRKVASYIIDLLGF